MHTLNEGDAFPQLEGATVAHGRVTLPRDIPENHWAIVLTYRADW